MSHRHAPTAPACELPDSCELEPRFDGTWADDRRERKATRYAGFGASAQRSANEARAKSDAIYDTIPFGQPIITGRGSRTTADRNRRDRAFNLRGKSHAEAERAAEWERRADAAESDTSISRNDPDAIEKIRGTIEALEHRRDRMKELNGLLRKSPDAIYMTPREAADWLSWLNAFHRTSTVHFKGYDLTNIGANIRRYQKRLEEFQRNAEAAATNGGYSRSMPNRWDGECLCGASVPAQAGIAAKPARGPWQVFCSVCWGIQAVCA